MPEERDLNDYILVFPADSGIKPIYVYLKDDPRNQAGTATGNGTQIENGKMWLDLSVTNNGEGDKIPAHIADKFRGRKYKDFREFREDLWLEVSKDPELSKQFSRGNLDAMREGNAPTGLSDGYYQGPTRLIKKYEIHHIKPIEDGGGVYDIDNLRIVTSKLHKFIHYGK